MHKFSGQNDLGWEELRIKRFRVNEEENHGLENHVDVYSHAHAKRISVFDGLS